MAITVYTYNDKVLKNVATDKWLTKKAEAPVDPYNPLGLPASTIRVKLAPGEDASHIYFATTVTEVQGQANVYDVYIDSTTWESIFTEVSVVEVLGANASNVTDISGLFSDCSSLTTVPLFDTSNVTSMMYMFSGCSSLTSVPLFNTSNVTDMSSMFNNCSSLTTVPLFDTSKVTEMSQMFNNCSSLTTVPLFNTSNVTSMSAMFNNCSSLTTVPLFDTSKVTYMGNTFKDCINVQSGALALYQQASTQTTPPSNHLNTFKNCGSNTVTGAAELAQIPSSWGGTGA